MFILNQTLEYKESVLKIHTH